MIIYVPPYTSALFGVTIFGSRLFSLSRWMTLACPFNNTESLFLLILLSLGSVKSLEMIQRAHSRLPNNDDQLLAAASVARTKRKTCTRALHPQL
jgi:hypothetical protein